MLPAQGSSLPGTAPTTSIEPRLWKAATSACANRTDSGSDVSVTSGSSPLVGQSSAGLTCAGVFAYSGMMSLSPFRLNHPSFSSAIVLASRPIRTACALVAAVCFSPPVFAWRSRTRPASTARSFPWNHRCAVWCWSLARIFAFAIDLMTS